MKMFMDYRGRNRPLPELRTYIEEQRSAVFLSFKGFDSYEILFEEGVIIPGKTVLRIDDGIAGQNYLVIDKATAEGVNCETYKGRQGRHNIRELFEEISDFSIEEFSLPKTEAKD